MKIKIIILLLIIVNNILAISFKDTVVNFGMASNNKQTLRIQTEFDIYKSFSGIFRLGMNKSLACGVCYKNRRISGFNTTFEVLLDQANNSSPIGLFSSYYKKSFNLEGINGPFGIKFGFYQTVRYRDSIEFHDSSYDRGFMLFIEKYIS